ncbi:MAG TPA: efflux transporter outer membrane subunit [Terriglobia bacterium]|jgi:NodT family efflux transporter outer membrane factor (OMF) lipoprotein
MVRYSKIVLFLFVLCAGCSIHPKYQRPVTQTPANLKGMVDNGQWKMAAPSDALLKGKWWEIFGDPQLNRLEEMVAVNNQNVKQAEAEFRQARALIAGARANYYPSIGTTPAISQSYVNRNSNQTFSIPANSSWEPDLWGRVRLAVESTVSNAQVSAADLENLRLSQQALLAADYFALAGQDMQINVLANTIAAYQQNLQLTINRYNGGVASRSDITLAQTQLFGAQAQSTEMHIARAQAEHAIAVLSGQEPSSFEIGPTTISGPPPPIPIGIPSQLLERRPDIAANERLVSEANIQVGIAQTAYYPTLNLSANPGLISSDLASLFTWASRSWSGTASMSETLFDFGRRGATVENSRAAYDATVAAYRQNVLAAFQEVEDDLASLRYLAEEAGQNQEAVTASQEALNLEMDRYKAGTDSYLNVITTQIIALNDQQSAISILQRRMAAAVDLVKSVGGGWDASTLPSADSLRATSMGNPKNTQNVARSASSK